MMYKIKNSTKQKAKFVVAAIMIAVFLMFIEYRVIMTHQQIEIHYDGVVSSTIFGLTDLYNTGDGGTEW